MTRSIFGLIKQKSNAFQLHRRGIIPMKENKLIKTNLQALSEILRDSIINKLSSNANTNCRPVVA